MSRAPGGQGSISRTAALSRLSFRHALLALVVSFVCCWPAAASSIRIVSTRVWPAAEYTRVTFESRQPIAHNVFGLKNPERLVLDLEDVAIDAKLSALVDKIGAGDPYVKGVRIGRFKPGTVRLVFDLKTEVKPQAFVLPPVGEYGHRLVLDLYPMEPPDPLIAFLDRQQAPGEGDGAAAAAAPAEARAEPEQKSAVEAMATAARKRPASVRLITVAVDAGHGGEDPGARGRRGTHEKDVTLAIARKLNNASDAPAPCDKIEGLEHIDKIIDIDQSPIGRTPRSHPATYTGAFTPIREWFAGLREAKAGGYEPGRFSFNV